MDLWKLSEVCIHISDSASRLLDESMCDLAP